MTECARDNLNGSTARWLEAVEANYLNGTGKKIKYRRDLDDLLWRYNVGEPFHSESNLQFPEPARLYGC